MAASVTCVVVAFHRPAALARLVAGLRHPDLEVVVVNVEDDPQAVLAAGDAVVLPSARNIGYAAAVNAGAALASAATIVFMNDDIATSAKEVLALAEVVKRGDAQVAVPRVATHRGEMEPTIAPLPTLRSLALEWLLLPDLPVPLLRPLARAQKWRRPEQPEAIPAAAAVMVATTRDLLRQEPLPEEYLLYWEESEWFWRLAQRGAVVHYRPEVIVRHLGGRSDVRPEKSRLLARNAVRCVRRTQGRAQAAAAIPLVVAWNLRLLARAAVGARRSGTGASLLRSRLAGLGAALGSWRELR